MIEIVNLVLNEQGNGILPPHIVVLARHTTTGAYSVWRSNPNTDTLLVDWEGEAVICRGHFKSGWGQKLDFYKLTRAQADQCVMAAVSLGNREAWIRFADRLVERAAADRLEQQGENPCAL